MKDSFKNILKLLNKEQKKAVNQIEGPVFVLAGPGTGKTHILATRVGQILTETDVYPSNVLCLTFSDSGANAMRERLIKFIGPTDAHRVYISTFHSFCNQVIQDNLELFGYNDLNPLSELERIEIIHQILNQLPFDNALKKINKDLHFYTRHLQNLFKTMKSEEWSPELIQKRTKEYLDELPNNPDFIYKRKQGNSKKGDLKTGKIETEEWKMERLSAAADLYPIYNKLLLQRKRYDYEDMILWVIQAFKKHPWLLRRYQEQFLYILVDEYQDTNGAQNQLLLQLINYWESPNIFIVGDDDQSIYEFQGARLHNLIDFYHKYQSTLQFIVLKDNYRSSQHILDAAGLIIDHNQNRITSLLPGLSKKLEAQNIAVKYSKIKISINAFPNKTQENIGILEEVKHLLEKGIAPEEIAILYARHKQARQLINLFKKEGIPYRTKKEVDILHEPIIKQLLNLLNYYSLETEQPAAGEHLIVPMLHFAFLKINIQDIATSSLYYQNNNPSSDQLTWKDLIFNRPKDLSNRLSDQKSLENLEAFLRYLFSEGKNLAIPQLFQHILTRSGLLAYVLEKEEKEWILNCLYTLQQFINKEILKDPKLELKDILVIFDKMISNRIVLPSEKRATNLHGVQFLTAHASKGLEFGHVFMMDLLEDQWGVKNSGGRSRFSFPENLTFSNENDPVEARRRLFYVALTRAKEQLFLSYGQQNEKGKPNKLCQFGEELKEHPDVLFHEKTISEEKVYPGILKQLEAPPPEIDLPDKERLEEMLEGFQLTISSLNSYLICPLGFYYSYVVKAPFGKSVGAAYGDAIHQVLEWLFLEMRNHKQKKYPSLKRMIKYFDTTIRKTRGAFDSHSFEHYLKKGKDTLTRVYEQHLPNWTKEVRLELKIWNTEIDGVPIKGVIDKIEFLPDNKSTVVDYKTTVFNTSKLARPTAKNPTGGSYWRQLTFYKILIENSPLVQRTVNNGTIFFLSPDKKGMREEKTISLNSEDVQLMKEIIKENYKKIKRYEFSQGCNEPNCPWCSLKERKTKETSLEVPEIEELDDTL